MKKIFVVFKKQKGDINNAYSLVDESIIDTIPVKLILKTKEVADRLYSLKELETLRDQLCD